MASREGFEPSLADLESVVLPLTLPRYNLVRGTGFEPAT